MKLNYCLRSMLFVTLAILVGAMAVASASDATLRWLASGVAITTAEPSLSVGEIELVNLKTLINTESAILCSVKFVGTVGPGIEDTITEVLDLSGNLITLEKRIVCTNVKGCPKPELAFLDLPWLTELELTGTEAEPLFLDKILNGGKGEPGYEIHCEVIGLPFEEACLGPGGSKLTNDISEGDVLLIFELQETLICTNQTLATAEIRTGAGDEEMLITLTSGLALSSSYE
jgi:hypothetical protein